MKHSDWVQDFIQRIDGNERVRGRNLRRMDAGETAFVAQQLEYIIAKPYETKYPNLKAREFIPFRKTADPGANDISYIRYDQQGKAEFIRHGTTNIPAVAVHGTKTTKTIETIAVKTAFTVQELRSAAFAGTPLDSMKFATCRKAIENKLDSVATLGDSALNMDGFVQLPNITSVTAISGTWSTATAAGIIQDVQTLWNSFLDTTVKGVFAPTHLLIPQNRWEYLTAPRSTSVDDTILKWLKDNLEGLQVIDKWDVLNTGDTAGTGTRMMAYEAGQDNFYMEMPIEFTIRPASPEVNLQWEVPCEARTAGIIGVYPLSVAHMDGV